MSNEAVIECRALVKRFDEGGLDVLVLDGVDLRVEAGQLLAIVGASGSGKSTLLHLLGGLDRPSAGDVALGGQSLGNLSAQACGRLRNELLGFVYQFHHLLPEFTCVENVAMPLLLRRAHPKTALDSAAVLLERVGLGERLAHKPGELSGGEQQRVAVARALVNQPEVVLADEPSGNLDEEASENLHALLDSLSRQHDQAFLVATHSPTLARSSRRTLMLASGVLSPVEQLERSL